MVTTRQFLSVESGLPTLNPEANKLHYRHSVLFVTEKAKTTQAQTRYALFMAKVLQHKEQCLSGFLGLKLLNATSKIKDARIGPQLRMKIKSRMENYRNSGNHCSQFDILKIEIE